jgi:uridylate kinase
MHKKVLIKFSGESFGAKGGRIDPVRVKKIVGELAGLRRAGVKIAIVCGGGNVSRWKDRKKGDRVAVDLEGIKGTLKNVRPLESALKKAGLPVKVYTSFALKTKYPVFNYPRVKQDFLAGKILIFAGGTGHPFFTTDTAAILRALEIGAEVFIKATKVEGIYTADPFKNPRAKKISSLSYKKFIEQNLKVIDPTAVALAWDNSLPIRIVKWEEGNVLKLIKGEKIGSVIN